jgi:hypothetical protein
MDRENIRLFPCPRDILPVVTVRRIGAVSELLQEEPDEFESVIGVKFVQECRALLPKVRIGIFTSSSVLTLRDYAEMIQAIALHVQILESHLQDLSQNRHEMNILVT